MLAFLGLEVEAPAADPAPAPLEALGGGEAASEADTLLAMHSKFRTDLDELRDAQSSAVDEFACRPIPLVFGRALRAVNSPARTPPRILSRSNSHDDRRSDGPRAESRDAEA